MRKLRVEVIERLMRTGKRISGSKDWAELGGRPTVGWKNTKRIEKMRIDR